MPAAGFLARRTQGLGLAPVVALANVPGIDFNHQRERRGQGQGVAGEPGDARRALGQLLIAVPLGQGALGLPAGFAVQPGGVQLQAGEPAHLLLSLPRRGAQGGQSADFLHARRSRGPGLEAQAHVGGIEKVTAVGAKAVSPGEFNRTEVGLDPPPPMAGLNQQFRTATGTGEVLPGRLLLNQPLEGAAAAFPPGPLHGLLDGPHVARALPASGDLIAQPGNHLVFVHEARPAISGLPITDMTTTISVMKTTSSLPLLERKIRALRRQLLALGPLHPGSITEQYHVCGNPNCRCMHPKKPQRHGPYAKLAYVHRGRPVCRFVRPECRRQLQDQLANYRRLRQIIDQWIALSIQRGTVQFFNHGTAGTTSHPKPGTPARRRQSKPD